MSVILKTNVQQLSIVKIVDSEFIDISGDSIQVSHKQRTKKRHYPTNWSYAYNKVDIMTKLMEIETL